MFWVLLARAKYGGCHVGGKETSGAISLSVIKMAWRGGGGQGLVERWRRGEVEDKAGLRGGVAT